VSEGIAEILLRRKAACEVLIEMIEGLHHNFQRLLAPLKPQWKFSREAMLTSSIGHVCKSSHICVRLCETPRGNTQGRPLSSKVNHDL
jgi:hypothetical protein